jgi:hypothetical protein
MYEYSADPWAPLCVCVCVCVCVYIYIYIDREREREAGLFSVEIFFPSMLERHA